MTQLGISDKTWKIDLDRLLSPKSIAIVGASESVGPARNAMRCLIDMSFDGNIYPIHPKHEQVFGIKCYKSLFELTEKPELVVIAVRADLVIEIMEQCEQLDITAVTIFTSGFSEIGSEGEKRQNELLEIANRSKIKVCGPNCLGHLDVINKTGAYSASILKDAKPGNVAIVSQSGSMAISMYQAFRDIGISHVISYGNQAVLDLSDYLMYLAKDPNTKVITTFIEGVNNGENFREAVRECRRNGKSIVAIKIGKTEISKNIAMAHTASIVGSDQVYTEVFKTEKILEVNDIDEMLQTVTALVKSSPIKKNGVAIMSVSGGQCGIVGDVSEKIGINIVEFSDETKKKIESLVPPFVNVRNPLDVSIVGSNDYTEYANLIRCCVNDENVGVVAIMQDAPIGVGPSTISHYSNIVKAVMEVFNETKKPIIVFTNHSTPYEPKIMQSLIDLGIPFLQGTQESLVAIKHLIDYYDESDYIYKSEKRDSKNNWEDIRNLLLKHKESKSYLGEKEGKELLNMIQIPVTKDILCKSVDDIKKTYSEFGGKVALKIDSPDIHHKTDVGGVALNLQSESEVTKAYHKMLNSVKSKKPNAEINGVIMQEMVPEGVDLIIGSYKDDQFGPIIVFGLGGIYVEIFKESSLGLIPISRIKAKEMIKTSKSYNLLKEVRGRDALDIEPLVDIIIHISTLMEHCGDLIKEIDLNPVRIDTLGVKALDALIGLE